jgi:hypothetical protein
MADGMPFVMTARMKQTLRGHGLTDAVIAEMTPGAAHKLIMAEAPCFTVIASLAPERLWQTLRRPPRRDAGQDLGRDDHQRRGDNAGGDT